MTNPTSGAADLPEALRLAAWLQEGAWHQMRLGDVEAAGRELRRLHIEITDLRAQLESIGAGGVSGRLVQAISAEPAAHVQNPAENEHVADDMSKNETGSNTAGAWIERWHGSGGKDGYEGWSIVNKDDRALVAYLGRGVDSEAVTKIVMAHNATRAASHGQAPATQQAGATKEHVRLVRVIADKIEDGTLFRSGIYSNKDLARFVRNVADAAAPQPSPTPQAAESVPAIQGEMNVQLDIDSNHSAPGQQRDAARSVALGQPMGCGPDQVAGHLGAQGDKLLTVAERNIRSFLRSAQFKGESDREAALNCVDVLWAAARDPADSVLEDAARWQMVVLVGNEVMLHPEKRSYAAAVAAYMDAVHRGLDLTGAIDSARKQGGA